VLLSLRQTAGRGGQQNFSKNERKPAAVPLDEEGWRVKFGKATRSWDKRLQGKIQAARGAAR